MLTYLDSLCEAMATRDMPRLRNLVEDHPLARLLPADAMNEVRHFLAQKAGRHAVPLVTLRFRDRTARLLSELPGDAVQRASASPLPAMTAQTATRTPKHTSRRRRSTLQTELPLSA